jgi:hypothetical protein
MSNTESTLWPQEEKQGRIFRPVSLPFFVTIILITVLLAANRGLAAKEESLASAGHRPQWRPAGAEAGSPLYGVNFISSAESQADEQQYQNGLATGASWNRWPIYWFNIEQSPGGFDWSAQDATVTADITHGLQINAILLGTPPFYTTDATTTALPEPPTAFSGTLALESPQAATPVGLYDPIFNDGTDIPGPGKQINESNVWARFVYTAVNRYKPGGVMAQANNWPAGTGVTHWEMWNEPDLLWFWDGTVADYARLLKVGYLTAKQADSSAQILFGALANNFEHLTYYDDVLSIYAGDPLAAGHQYFHDILATHSYFYAWQSWYHVWRAGIAMAAHGLDKPIWLNETGVPAWDDYPGPIWDPKSGLRATVNEQADFAIQSAFYATYAGADAIFHFQLYDGCGNQPQGTDFPPHNGELCDENGRLIGNPDFPCAGDANGLYRNPTDVACFTQHPQPETPRPNFTAFQVLTSYVTGVEPLWRMRPGNDDPVNGPQEWIALYRPSSSERVLGMWARFGQAETAVVPATNSAGSGLLITPDGVTQKVTAVDGTYILSLPAATNQNAPWDPMLYPIGGRPLILIERDTMAPTVAISVTADYLTAQIEVNWSGSDLGSGMQNYDVTVAIDGGAPTPWLTATTAVSGVFSGEPDHLYTFTVIGRDRANISSAPATAAIFMPILSEGAHLPFIGK